MSKPYHSNFHWKYSADGHVIVHTDGYLSIMILWDGISFELDDESSRERAVGKLARFYGTIEPGVMVEAHHWRAYDNTQAVKYVEESHNLVRQQEVGSWVRELIGNHIGSQTMTNSVAFVLTKAVGTVRGASLFPAKAIKQYDKEAENFFNNVKKISDRMPGGRIANIQQYGEKVLESSYRDRARQGNLIGFDARFNLNEQWSPAKPEWDGRLLRVGNTYTFVGLMDLYPDEVSVGWYDMLAQTVGPEIHTVQIIKPTKTSAVIKKQEDKEDKESQGLQRKGRSQLRRKVLDLKLFNEYVADNGLAIVENTMVFHIHHPDKDYLNEFVDNFIERIEEQGGRLQSDKNISYLYFRVGMPGHGYCGRFLRPDSHEYVTAIAPIQVFDKGMGSPNMLRMTSQGEGVLLDYVPNAPNHGFTAAKSRSGKGVQKVVSIMENYPRGVDYYICEVGGSYRWVVKALGGKYLSIDPDVIVINPFPPYKDALIDGERISAKVVGPTIEALAFILTGGKNSFSEISNGNHIKSRAQQVMEIMYANPSENATTPSLIDYYAIASLKLDGSKEDLDMQCYQTICENLDSFMKTPSGKRFIESEDNLDLSGTLVAVDFKPLMACQDKDLATFFMTNVILRFGQQLFFSRNKAEFVIDELHELARINRPQVTTLCEQVARMGAKENSFLDLISQEPEDVKLNEAIVKQMNHRTLLYMSKDHEDVAQSFGIESNLVNLWKSYPDCATEGLPYRPGIKTIGEKAWDIHFTFPQEILDIADSNPDDLTLKEQIESEFEVEWDWAMLTRYRAEKELLKQSKEANYEN